MIPEERLSTELKMSRFLYPWGRDPLVSMHLGPVALNNPSQGLSVKLWTLRQEAGNFLISSDDVEETVLFTRSGAVQQLSLSFTQNGSPTVAFMEDGVATLWWFDSLTSEMVFTTFAGVTDPRLALDEFRVSQGAMSDVIFAYIRSNSLYYRQQRDRYDTERLLKLNVTELLHVSSGTGLRLLFVTKDFGIG